MPWTVMAWVALPGGHLRQMTWRNRMSVISGILGCGNGPFLPEMEFDDAGLPCLVSQAPCGCHVPNSRLHSRYNSLT